MMGSSTRSVSGSISDSLSEDLRRKLQAASYAYKAKKEQELAYTECKELDFLMVDPDSFLKTDEPLDGIGGNTCDLDSFEEETYEITTLHQSR
nr:hypothetical protein [Tanacetum cinerariifolium]GEY76370.1 hypothetical protein [Tanacetum cinerariifolium]